MRVVHEESKSSHENVKAEVIRALLVAFEKAAEYLCATF